MTDLSPPTSSPKRDRAHRPKLVRMREFGVGKRPTLAHQPGDGARPGRALAGRVERCSSRRICFCRRRREVIDAAVSVCQRRLRQRDAVGACRSEPRAHFRRVR